MHKQLLLGALLLAASPLAQAGAFSDTLSVCLVKKSSAEDKTLLVRWIFAGLGHHPEVRDLSKVSEAESERLNKEVAGLFMALMTDRCATETHDAMKYEGDKAIETGFETLGRVATQGLMGHPDVAAFIAGLDKHLDKEKLEALGKDAAAAK